ncbi:MAG: radical SAM protein [Pyrobaculum sp.]
MYYNEARGPIAFGCDMCLMGAKSVIFITGVCPLNCFYCPVGSDRFGKDIIYVNDVPIERIEDIPKVVAQFATDGAAITGGDPAVVPERVNAVAEILKKELGESFHIHMYTHILNLDSRRVGVLAVGKIDEVRIHVISRGQIVGKERYLKALAASGKSIGVEVPALPGFEKQIVEAIDALRPYIAFVNINELDISESNIERLKAMGYKTEGLNVPGSLNTARKIAEMIKDISVHICVGKTKDLVQIGSRLFRHAMATARFNEYVNDDGTVAYEEGGKHPKSLQGKKIRLKLSLGGREVEVA